MNDIYSTKPFIQTKEYKRFVEFAQSCMEYKYIGICYGNPGVGKTFSAHEFTHPEVFDYYEYNIDFNVPLPQKVKNNFHKCNGVFMTVPVCNTPKIIKHIVYSKTLNYGNAALRIKDERDLKVLVMEARKQCPLLIVDEADRLNYNALEELRALFDEYQFGLILMGMPGIEKRLSRYAQLYSRIGFLHEFKSITKDEMMFLFEQKWKKLGHQFKANVYLDVEAMNEIIKITHGNFRLIYRIFDQIERIMKINNLQSINKELVEAARNCLVIGDFL